MTSRGLKFERCVNNDIRINWSSKSNHLINADRQLGVSDIEILI